MKKNYKDEQAQRSGLSERIDANCASALFSSHQIEYLKALQTLGMKCLVMNHYGAAFASEFMLALNEDETRWVYATAKNPFARCLRPGILDGYAQDWKISIVDLDSFLSNRQP